MVNIDLFFSSLPNYRVGVVGDIILDRYTIGKVKRISPEAPVLILSAEEEKEMLGGASNALLGMKSLGLSVSLMGRIGADSAGEKALALLEEEGVFGNFLVKDPSWITPQKHRMVASSQQLLRIDKEHITPISHPTYMQLISMVDAFLSEIDLLALSDYGKGLFTKEFCQYLITKAKERKIPVLIDPKGTDYSKYEGASIIKPNLKEAYEATKEEGPLERIASLLFEKTFCDLLIITKSEEGISLFYNNPFERIDIPSIVREIKDVTGAGDTVLAMTAAGVVSGLEMPQTMNLANIAASIAIEKMGCVRVTAKEIIERFEHQMTH